jgi:hypothetical protein
MHVVFCMPAMDEDRRRWPCRRGRGIRREDCAANQTRTHQNGEQACHQEAKRLEHCV